MTMAHNQVGPCIELERSLPSQVAAISPFVDRLMLLFRKCGCVSEGESGVEIALREALANAIIHGNHENPGKHVYVRCRCKPDEISIAVKEEPLISLVPGNLVQQFIDRHLARAGVFVHPRAMFNYLDTMIAMVEAGEGNAVIPSFVLPACRNRKVVMSRLINPVVNLDFCRISLRGKKLPPGADDFTSFLRAYIARWAGSAGIL